VKNKRLLLIFLTFFFSLQICLRAQDQYLLPGVTDNIVLAIQTQVNTVIGDKYEVTQVLNVDSSLGSGLSPRWPDVGAIENPYGTLTHCFVFNGTRRQGATSTDSASGIVGVFKSGQILWHSDGILTVKPPGMMANTIWTIKDINRDGKVEILTTWISLSSGTNPPMYLWIFSWEGQKGEIINARDKNKQSILKIDSYGLFSLIDNVGKDIWEIQGPITSYEGDSTRTEFRTFSWNGSLYGLWPNTPQPSEGTSYPKDKAQGTVYAKVVQVYEKFQYRYYIQNSSSSLQDIQEFAIDRLTDSVTFAQSRKFWDSALPWLPVVSWKCDGLYGSNYIRPGEKDSDFVFTTIDTTLPRLIKFYVQGLNGESSDDITNNSFYGSTIGPSNLPVPFIPLNFLDTLTNYTTQSRTLGWVKDQTTSNKYLGYFASAKTSLGQNNITSTRTTLQQVLQDVNVDSTSHLTSEAYALIRYNTEYLLAQLPTAPSSGCVVKLVNSTGSLLTTGTLQYRDSTWKDATSNNDGTFTITTTRKKLNLRMTYEYGTQTKSNVPVKNDTTIIFQTKNVTVDLQTSSGNPLDTGTVQYNAGGWKDFGTTTNGVATKELLPIKYKFKMTYNNASNEKTQNIDSNAVVLFQTVNVSVQLKNSTGNFIDQGVVQYNSGGWKDFGITSNGSVHKELLPAKYNFKMTYASASKNQAQDLDSNAVVVFQTSNVSVQLKSSQGTPLDTGVVQYNAGGWKDFGTTANGVANKELLPIKYTFRMTYGYANNEKAQNTDSNAVVTFQTVNAVVQLKNSQGNTLDIGTVQYNAGGWKNFGTTTNGTASKELLANKYNFRMTYAFVNNDKSQNLDSSNIVRFSTVLCSVRVTNSSGQLVSNAIVTYNASGWKPFGTTVNGIATKELLPANITFKAQSGKTTQTKAQDITTNPNVEIGLP
jgi:hypothetical protein